MNPLKQIIYINGRFLTQPITGVQRYGHEIVKSLDNLIYERKIDKNEYQFILLTPKRGLLFQPSLQYIKIRKIGKLTGHLWEQFDLPHYSKYGLLFCPGNTAPLSSLKFSQKVVVTLHDLSFQYFPHAYSLPFKMWYQFLIPIIFARANAIITVSESERSSMIKYYPNSQQGIHTVQNGGLPHKYFNIHNKGKYPNQKKSILYVGALSRRKNFENVLRAFEIASKKTELNLIIAGASSKTFQKIDLSMKQDFGERIIFKGQINNIGELIPLYQQSLCLVFPSFYEASPLPPIEAMSCDCPVIASSIPSLKERCGDAALYCDPDDPQDIADKIGLLLENQNLRNSLIKKGKKRAAQFNWEICASKTFKILKQVLIRNENDI